MSVATTTLPSLGDTSQLMGEQTISPQPSKETVGNSTHTDIDSASKDIDSSIDNTDETISKLPANEKLQSQSSAVNDKQSSDNIQSSNQTHEHNSMTSQSSSRIRHTNTAIIEGDASTAFSHYRPVPLSCLSDNYVDKSDVPPNRLLANGTSMKHKKKGRIKKKRVKRRGGNDQKDESNVAQTSAHHMHSIDNDDQIHSILQQTTSTDSIIQTYLPQLKYVDTNYYSKVKPYRMGKRHNLPLDQIEVILRRRAVIKKSDDVQNVDANGTATNTTNDSKRGNEHNNAAKDQQSSISRQRLPPPHNSPPRRKLFPTQQQHSPTPSYHCKSNGSSNGYYEDDSTISSTTVASQLTFTQQQQRIDSSSPQQQQSNTITNDNNHAMTIDMPKEEIVGDTSLGLKLTILQGKVIIQNITPLSDGRASPAQLCGLLSIGDIIIGVNGKSLINGSINNPVSMDRIISVLKPLSQPIVNGTTKEYTREVRLRFVLGKGKSLLDEQDAKEKRKLEEIAHRKKYEKNQSSMTIDPAADLFGIASFMAVDQHSGMPLFGNLEHHTTEHQDDEKDEKESEVVAATKVQIVDIKTPIQKQGKLRKQSLQPLSLQAQIAHEIQLDRQWTRHRNTSEFFSLNSNASILLRPPSPPPVKDMPTENPIDARKRQLEQGAETMELATSLVSIVEKEDNGIETFEDEDPMEVASRVCGTASVRTGSSRRRWHRGADSVIAEEEETPSVSSDNPNMDGSSTTFRSVESGIEECDHKLLIELAANNESWKMNVLKRLESSADETEKENIQFHRSNSNGSNTDKSVTNQQPSLPSFDTFLFGGDVTKILGKKKQSLALPSGEMTSMLFDLVELLESGLPDQIFMNDESSTSHISSGGQKVVSFAKSNHERNEDVINATDYLINQALCVWLKSFRPLPLKQRRALWPSNSSTMESDSLAESKMSDNESLSLMSGTTTNTRSLEKAEKRNLRELIEDLELDHETRRETCRLVTFYFMHRYSGTKTDKGQDPTTLRLSSEVEKEAATFIDRYGSYLDIYKCLILAGKLHSKTLVDKLVNVAKYDSRHKEAVKSLKKAKVLLFYEPNMLPALLELLPTIGINREASDFDYTSLLVSAYPDLQPWCIQESSGSDGSDDIYMKYLSSLLHYEDGNDSAKQDGDLVREYCSLLCSLNEADSDTEEKRRQSFFNIASQDNSSSRMYHRDLLFLMDCSVKISEFSLTLSIANEIISSQRYRRDKQVLADIIQHLRLISNKAIEGNEGEVNTVLLAQVVSFYSVISKHCIEAIDWDFNIVDELSRLVTKCYDEHQNNLQDVNIDACITTISETAPPTCTLQVLSQWEHTSVISTPLLSAFHTCLIRGARDGVRSEISGSLLQIQRAREEGRRPIVDKDDKSNYWGDAEDNSEDEEDGGGIWSSILNGTLEIAK